MHVWLSGLAVIPQKRKTVGSTPGQGTCPDCEFSPRLGYIREATDQCFPSSLSLSFSLSLKINEEWINNFFFKEKKRCTQNAGTRTGWGRLTLHSQHPMGSPRRFGLHTWRVWATPQPALCMLSKGLPEQCKDFAVPLFASRTMSSWVLGNNLFHLFLEVRSASPPLGYTCFYT